MAVLAVRIIFYQFENRHHAFGNIFITPALALLAQMIAAGVIFMLSYRLLKVARVSTVVMKNAILALSSLLLTLLFIEIILRVKPLNESLQNYGERSKGHYMRVYDDSKRSAYLTHNPNSLVTLQTLYFKYERHTNSLGLSFPEMPVTKEHGEIRIMAVGDSFTEGDGAPADSTWMKSLERELTKNYPSQKFSFINAGVCGSDPVFELKLFNDKLLDYRPDFLIAAINLSDIDDLVMHGGEERFISNEECRFRSGPWWEPVYAFSYLFRLAVHTKYNKVFLTDEEDEMLRGKAVADIVKTMHRFHQLAESNGIKFITALMPVAVDVLQEKFNTLQPVLDSLGSDPPFRVINLFDYYTSQAGMNHENVFNYYWRMDGHHTGKGYSIFGRAVADYFLEHRLIEDFAAADMTNFINPDSLP